MISPELLTYNFKSGISINAIESCAPKLRASYKNLSVVNNMLRFLQQKEFSVPAKNSITISLLTRVLQQMINVNEVIPDWSCPTTEKINARLNIKPSGEIMRILEVPEQLYYEIKNNPVGAIEDLVAAAALLTQSRRPKFIAVRHYSQAELSQLILAPLTQEEYRTAIDTGLHKFFEAE